MLKYGKKTRQKYRTSMRQEGKVREINQPGNRNSIIVQARGMCGKVHAYGKEKDREKR